jgi:hypothetical protein
MELRIDELLDKKEEPKADVIPFDEKTRIKA